MAAPLDYSKLMAFNDAAAGHEGVLTDESGGIVVKPCTPAELAFYEETNAHHTDLAALMPTFMGTVQLGQSSQLSSITLGAAGAGDATTATNTSDASTTPSAPLPLHGAPLDTPLGIVLQNVASGYTHPNILDIKLGARLWDDDAPESKRQKLDAVAAETTSGTLGLRVAGMKVWNDEAGGRYRTFDKWYGRGLRGAGDVADAFAVFLDREGDREGFESVVAGVLEAVREVESVVRAGESRMYSASLLFVYEGERGRRREVLEKMARVQGLKDGEGEGADEDEDGDGGGGEDEGDEDVGEGEPKLFDLKLIDFAHASWTPGQGPDENMLHGIRNVIEILQSLA